MSFIDDDGSVRNWSKKCDEAALALSENPDATLAELRDRLRLAVYKIREERGRREAAEAAARTTP
jgi:hypothetical protein